MAKPTDIAVPEPTDVSSMSYTELMEHFSKGGAVHVQELDDLVKVSDKNTLCGTPFIILDWRYNPSGNLGEFMFVEIRTANNDHMFFTDGSTGVKDQLLAFEAKMGERKPIYVPQGLRVSNYMYHDPDKNIDIPASTFYINNES